jgi:hypothetical protein
MTCPTHFVVEDRTHVHAFDIETCDSCGCQAEAANAVGIRTTAAQMRMLGSKELTERLPELGYCDALGMAVCPACYVDEPIA